ncbi:MAG: L,D-transpeptidase [Ignavibacteriaceae bacterium]
MNLKNISSLLFFLITASLILFFGCSDKKNIPSKKVESLVDSSAIKDSIRKAEEEKIEIHYSFMKIKARETIKFLTEKYDAEGRKLIFALNRLDVRNLRNNDSLIIPDTVFKSIMPYSPFPKNLDSAKSIKKLLIFSYPIQAFAAYENGSLVKWGPTSMGKKSTPTPTGLFHTNWKAKKTTSTVNEEWILPWYFNLDNKEGVSLHQFDLPGYPASHACARLLDTDATWIYYWAEQWILNKSEEKVIAYGTPVIIYGKYDFKNKIRPWKKLVDDPKANNISEKELNEIINKYLSTITKRAEVRDSIIAMRNSEKDSLKKIGN